MARGVISGVVTGVVVAAVAVVTAALVVNPVDMSAVRAPVAEAPDPAAAPQAPLAEAPASGAPEAGMSEAVTPEAEVDGPADARAPDLAETETEVEADPAPEAEAETAPEAPAVQPAPPEAETPAPAAPAPAEDLPEPAAPLAPEAEPAPALPAEADPAPEMAQPAATPAPEEGDAAADDPAADPAPEAGNTQLPLVIAPGAPPAPETTLRAGGGAGLPRATPDADRLDDPAPQAPVVSDRLPSIGRDEAAAPESGAAAGAQRAIRRNAAPYEAVTDLPEMAVLLIDTGPVRGAVGDLALMPFPLSVAVDASAPDAEAAVDFYRAAGAEVVLIVPLPEGATAVDVDVTFQAYEPLLKKAVAVMIDETAGFQGLGDAALQVVTNTQELGLGLVSFPEGLNTGHKSAVKEGVPAGLVFRDLDGEGQAPDVIRRFMDNVAFRARNDNGVIAVARVRPETLQALLEWSLGNRAQSVNFAPVSAVLQGG